MPDGPRPYFQLIALIYTLLCASLVHASPYEVLVVDISRIDNGEKIEEFEENAKQLNALHLKGYLAAKPYFDVLHMTNGFVYLVFGFRGEVQGIHRENYHRTVKNLGRIKAGGVQKYPNMHWVPVEGIRKLLLKPQ